MSNLGGYQVMTTLAKNVGGPTALGLIVFGSGCVTTGIVIGIVNKVKQSKKNSKKEENLCLN